MTNAPTGRRHPTVRLRRLAAELRRLRQAAGLSQDDVARSTDINVATLYRIESARGKPQLRTLKLLLDAYGVPGDLRLDLMRMQKEATQRSWLHDCEIDLSDQYTAYITLEAEAAQVTNYESLIIPGLLQTEDYARAVIRGGRPSATDTEVKNRVAARLRRQKLLEGDKPLHLWAIMDQAALVRTVGGTAVMRKQLDHLGEQASRPHITIQVIPFSAGAHPGVLGSFIVLNFVPNVPEVIHIDSMAGELFLEKEADIQRYSAICEHLRAIALSPRDTIDLITSLRDNL